MAKHPSRPRDPNQLAKLIADIATGEKADPKPTEPASTRGQPGGLKGGKARANKLSSERRRQIAKDAADKRWAKER